MAKYSKKNTQNIGNGGKVALLILLSVLLAALVWLASLLGQREVPTLDQTGVPDQISGTEQRGTEAAGDFAGSQETMPEPTQPQVIELSDGLVIHCISGYAGIYMEDGSDEPVADVMMIILENTSEQDLQLARISLEYSAFTAEFEVTNLPAGEKVLALEKNRHPEVPGEYLSIQTKNVVFFPETMSLQEDRIRIAGHNGTLEVTNISQEDITGDIFIYYKNSAEDLFYGGITYRVAVKGGLAAGESTQIITGHYTPNNCRLVLVDCGD